MTPNTPDDRTRECLALITEALDAYGCELYSNIALTPDGRIAAAVRLRSKPVTAEATPTTEAAG